MIRLVASLSFALAGLALCQPSVIAGGTRWETAYHVIEGEISGPTVVITGGIHGDEPAGHRAAEQILHWPILKGRLIVIPAANRHALASGKRLIPGLPKSAADLNRNFPRAGQPDRPNGELSEHLWKFIAQQHPDWLIDLHEGYAVHRLQPKSVGSTLIHSENPRAEAAARKMLAAVNATIADDRRHFEILSTPIDGSLARAAAEHLGAATVILETTSRDRPLSGRTRQHRIMLCEFLVHLGMLSPEFSSAMRPPANSGNAPRVAIFDDEGTGKGGPENIEGTLHEIPGSLAWRIGADDIREGALEHFDLLVVPGGSGGAQGRGLGENGRAEIRRFVREGGGYVGICAGAYLAAANYPWSLGLANYGTFSEIREIPVIGSRSMWFRGPSAMVAMELTDAGKTILGNSPGFLQVRYHNGPVIRLFPPDAVQDYHVLAWFRSEVSHYETQRGSMIHTPAIIAAACGKGRVLAISPHPEATKELRPMLAKGLKWAAGD